MSQNFIKRIFGKQSVAKSSSITQANNDVFNIEFSSQHLSAFGDFVQVPLTQIINIDFVNGIPDGCIVVSNGTGASVTVANNQASINSGTSSTGYSVLCSDRPIRYRARLGVHVGFTPVFATPITNCQQLKGVANVATDVLQTIIDGYFYGYYVGTDSTATSYDGTTFGILHVNSASGSRVDRFYPSTQWSDPCDGTGNSGVNWVKTNGIPISIDYPYQGYGNISFKIQNPNTGNYFEILAIKYANSTSIPQLSNPNMRYWDGIINSGNTTAKSTKTGSVAAFICGEKRYVSRPFPAFNNKTVTSGNILPLLCFQVPATFNSNQVRGLLRLMRLGGYSSGNSFGFIHVYLNPTTLTGVSWVLNDTTLTIPTGGTASLTGTTGSYTINADAGFFAVNPLIKDISSTAITGGRLVASLELGIDTNDSLDFFTNQNKEPIPFQSGDIIAIVADPKANGSMGVTVEFISEL